MIYNDRFGFLSCLLSRYNPTTIINHKSNEKALLNNLLANELEVESVAISNSLDAFEKAVDIALIKIPKSLELFRLFLYQLSQKISADATVVCAFMTKHFSPQILSIAAEFFDLVEQSRAWKKSRLLVLTKPKSFVKQSIIHKIKSPLSTSMEQYYGVFSAKHIDYASQFLIEHLEILPQEKRILDLASGNGILAAAIRKQNPTCELHLMDDFYLAVASSKLNLEHKNTVFHYNDSLDIFEANYFDCMVSNPPFHFEYEVSIATALRLFKEAKRCLKEGGRFQLVANQHLNYKTHLTKLFKAVKTVAQNKKFIIYNCLK